jgi:hypothetical protein
VGFGVIGIELNGPAVRGDCLIQFPLVSQHIPEAVVGSGEIRLQLEDPAERGGCLLSPAQGV